MSIIDILTGKRVEELKDRMATAISCEQELTRELKATSQKMGELIAKMEAVSQALNSHKECLNALVTELRNVRR